MTQNVINKINRLHKNLFWYQDTVLEKFLFRPYIHNHTPSFFQIFLYIVIHFYTFFQINKVYTVLAIDTIW